MKVTLALLLLFSIFNALINASNLEKEYAIHDDNPKVITDDISDEEVDEWINKIL